eukprot:TRINITY_DN9172_c0_g1_i4.p1 TRINITY_DN9172_c0_g1~~TRINITY_DN9172_c0_g1_i4.p1  ORF type:complete len:283 (-),score=65.06 TRINITY_DN9172_c0_g1_i4:488-1336(-)
MCIRDIFFFFFFFQAEDGIRDVERSRGLGDVYKRQVSTQSTWVEKEMTGLYITGHPLDDYVKSLKIQTTNQISEVYSVQETLDANETDEILPSVEIFKDEVNLQDNDRVILGGILANVNQKITRNNAIMAFLTLEDLTGSIEVIVFPKTLEKVKSLCITDSLVIIKGRLSIKEDEAPKLICESMDSLEKIDNSKLYLRLENVEKAKEFNKFLKEFLKEDQLGDTPIYFYASKENKKFRAARDRWICLESDIEELLIEKLGEENVKVVEDQIIQFKFVWLQQK